MSMATVQKYNAYGVAQLELLQDLERDVILRIEEMVESHPYIRTSNAGIYSGVHHAATHTPQVQTVMDLVCLVEGNDPIIEILGHMSRVRDDLGNAIEDLKKAMIDPNA